MGWHKCDLWKAGIVVAGALLFLVLMAWVPLSAASAHQGTPEVAIPGTITVQATPTEDATVTALNKEKLAQEVNQLKNQNEQLRNQNEPDLFGWLRTNAALLISTLIVVIGGLIGLFRWFADRRSEREKQAEGRFQSAVTGLGDDKEEVRIGAAILLRTFLRPDYEQFYIQTFDLAVAHLRLPRESHSPEEPNASLPLTTLSHALIVVFKEAFPLARDQEKRNPHFLDASGIRLNHAYLLNADLKQAWMPQASLQEADLSAADLSEANLSGADLSKSSLFGADLSKTDLDKADLRGAKLNGANLDKADLRGANLSGANLSTIYLSFTELSKAKFRGAKFSSALVALRRGSRGVLFSGADLSEADLSEADLSEADLRDANLSGAKLRRANLSGARLYKTNFSRADLSVVNFSGTDLSGANFGGADLSGTDLSGVKLGYADSLKNADLRLVIGLTKEQLAACKAAGAIVDEDSAASSSQSTTPISPSSQSNNTQASLAPPAQGSLPPPDTGASSAAAPKQSSES